MSQNTDARADAARSQFSEPCTCPACSSPFASSSARNHIRACNVFCGDACDCGWREDHPKQSDHILKGARAC